MMMMIKIFIAEFSDRMAQKKKKTLSRDANNYANVIRKIAPGPVIIIRTRYVK